MKEIETKPIIHRFGIGYNAFSECGLSWCYEFKGTRDWKKVTCKRCFKTRLSKK